MLRRAGYELMIGDSGYDAPTEAALVRSFLGRRVDALNPERVRLNWRGETLESVLLESQPYAPER